jgi:mono/diheme cytochrome c family protein
MAQWKSNRIAILATPLAFLVGACATPTYSGEDSMAAGKQVYRENRCSMCHSIAGEGNQRSPLDGVGSRLTEEEIRKWIVDPQSMQADVRKPSYDSLSDENLEALVSYMASLTEE